MSVVKIVTGFEALTARQILTWFAMQEEGVQIEIIRCKQSEQKRVLGRFTKHDLASVELAALILATNSSGWADEQAYRSSKSLSADAARRITERRQARAGAYLSHREQVHIWLAKHWGKVMDMRRVGLSWRRVSVMIAVEYGINISHTALHKYWRSWNEPF